MTCPVNSGWLCFRHDDKQINRISSVVLVCHCSVGRGSRGNHHQPARAASRIVGLSLLLDVRYAIHDCRCTDLRVSSPAQSCHDWLCAFPRAADHDGDSNRRRIYVAIRGHFFGIDRPQWRCSCFCGGLSGEKIDWKSGLSICRLRLRAVDNHWHRQSNSCPTRTSCPTRISRGRGRFLFYGDYAESPSNELNRGSGKRRRQPGRLPESRRRVVSEW